MTKEALLLGFFFIAFQELAAESLCQLDENAFPVPTAPLGITEPFTLLLDDGGKFATEAGKVQQQCCVNSAISSWRVARNDLEYMAYIAAECKDGTLLDPIIYGHNGSAQTCDWGMREYARILNPADNVFAYTDGLVLDSFLQGDQSFSCGSGSYPIGFSGASSCFAITSFQVICSRPEPYPELRCPVPSTKTPSTPLGEDEDFSIYYVDNNGNRVISESASHPGRQVTHCCPGSQIANFTLRQVEQYGYIGEVAATCTDGFKIPAVSRGFNGTGKAECKRALLQLYTVQIPEDGRFTYKSGAILDSFMDESDNLSFFCEPGTVPIGFAASSSCFAVTNFQVVCSEPLKIESQSSEGQIKGNFKAAKAILIVAFVAILSLSAGFAFKWAYSNVNVPHRWRPWRSKDERFDRLDLEECFTDDPFANTPAPDDDDEEDPGELEMPIVVVPKEGPTVPFPEDLVGSKAVGLESMRLSSTNSDIGSLPENWKIPISLVELRTTANGRPWVLGEGAFGKVYLGVARGEVAAIKVVTGGGRSGQAKLLHEIEILEQCRSQHIVQFLGYSMQRNQLLLIMAYVPGGTLYDGLHNLGHPQRRSRTYQYYNRGREALISIVTALCNLHGNSFAHFDLKTPNVLIASDGSVKVADVGLGKLVMGSQDIKLSHSGTFVWAAPEQLDLHGSKGSFASDMFALSTIIHEISTLEKPVRQLRHIRVPEEAPQKIVDLFFMCRKERPSQRIKAHEALRILQSSE